MAGIRKFFDTGAESWKRDRLCLLALVSLCPNCVALGTHEAITQYVQTTLTVKNGLPQNSVGAIAQTRDGYLWFGTEEGIARYDGLQMTVFDTAGYRALKDNFIDALAAGRDGSLWVGTRSCLTQMKNGEFHTYFTAQSPINTIYEAQDGQIWVGSLEGLYAVQGNRILRYTTKDGLPSNDVGSISQSADGTLWFGTTRGLASLKNGKFRMYGFREGLTADPVLSLAMSHDGSVWVATTRALFRWRDRLLETVPFSRLPKHDQIASLLEDRRGELWIGFNHSGIATLRKGELIGYRASQGLPTDDVSQIFEDREGHLWIGLQEGGVVELRDGIFGTFGKQEGLSDDMVWSVLEARDRSLWVGTNDKGLNHIAEDGKVRVYTVRDGLPSNTIFAIFESRDRSLWIGSEDGSLSRLKNDRITVFRDPASKGHRIASIDEDASGDLWLGFHELNGLVRFHEGHFQHYAVPGLVNTAVIAPDGSIWVGSDHAGVSRIRNGSVTTFTTQNGLLSNFAQAVYVDRDGVVWAGTSPGGLNRIENGHVTTYSIDQGLFDLTVGAIAEDDAGYLWMTCNKGIYKVSKKELNDYAEGRVKAIHSIVFGAADGLRSIECNFGAEPSVWKGSDGRLWFPTTAGVASVDPNHSQITVAEPLPLIEGVLFNHRSIPFAQGVTAGPGEGDLEIRFTTPDFVAPERIQFRYRLQNSDANWVDVGGRRQAFYTKLPPGHYVFEVQGANGVNSWNSKVARLDVVLKPRFWQTGWFQGLCALILVFACAALYGLSVRYLVERNRELEKRVLKRTAELQDALKVAEAAQSALQEQATKDDLTKLWNRRSIFELLDKEMLRATRDRMSIVVLMADLDHFKFVNDTLGHLAGDSLLQQVAARFLNLTRSYDFVGRYGGEEFIIVLPGCSLTDGLRRAEVFRCAIANSPLSTSVGPIQVTCSFGVAASFGDISSEELIKKADDALYCAKRFGRNRVHEGPQKLQDAPVGAELPVQA
ncbi:MAG: two-component regulator propeller domain-containing protein [Terracidiphilus sp.]